MSTNWPARYVQSAGFAKRNAIVLLGDQVTADQGGLEGRPGHGCSHSSHVPSR